MDTSAITFCIKVSRKTRWPMGTLTHTNPSVFTQSSPEGNKGQDIPDIEVSSHCLPVSGLTMVFNCRAIRLGFVRFMSRCKQSFRTSGICIDGARWQAMPVHRIVTLSIVLYALTSTSGNCCRVTWMPKCKARNEMPGLGTLP